MVKVEEIVKLSKEEKVSLIELIWDILDSEDEENLLTKEQQYEISQRIDRYERGEGKTYTWEEVEARLKF